MSTSVGSNTSAMPVIELTVVPPSLIESAAMCEWQSMMPGDTNVPVASTMSAPAGIDTFVPTAAILPSRSRIVPFWIVPFVTVTIVPPRIATTGGVERFCASGRPNIAAAKHADATGHANLPRHHEGTKARPVRVWCFRVVVADPSAAKFVMNCSR
jgi:hypothetical protein